jgi:hypothetical protein
LGLAIGVTSDILVSLMRTYNKTQVGNEIEQQSGFVTARIEKQLRNAEDVDIPGGGLRGNALDITLGDSATKVTYSLDSSTSAIRYIDATGQQSFLTAPEVGGVVVSCPSQCFTITQLSTGPKVVTYNFIFAQGQQTSGISASFTGGITVSNSVVIRNTYYTQ